ncbi:hypothetical protein ACIO1C_05780 [Streptomyces sp. NPDC087420]|uniref:hypothetical protein n=1 Tax=Streptomyces sp. NPDC087420 TaxID=3365785 RepID=UPI003836F888
MAAGNALLAPTVPRRLITEFARQLRTPAASSPSAPPATLATAPRRWWRRTNRA